MLLLAFFCSFATVRHNLRLFIILCMCSALQWRLFSICNHCFRPAIASFTVCVFFYYFFLLRNRLCVVYRAHAISACMTYRHCANYATVQCFFYNTFVCHWLPHILISFLREYFSVCTNEWLWIEQKQQM